MVKGYYTDKTGNVLGYFELPTLPENTDKHTFIVSDEKPDIYVPPPTVEEQKASLLDQIRVLEEKIYYSELDGDTEWVNTKKAQRLALKQQLREL